MRLFWELALRAFQRQLTYRAAVIAGLMTNFFFGILRVSVFTALYAGRPEMSNMTLQDAITYTALSQGLIGYLSLFNWYDLMNSVYNGSVASDLLKPMGYFRFWLAQDAGRAVAQLLLRGLPILFGYALFFELTIPRQPVQWMGLGLSLILAWLISFSWRFLLNLASFWMPDALGVGRLGFVIALFLSGFLLPLRFFPDWAARLMALTPFPHALNTIFEIYLGLAQGPAMWQALGYQALWALALVVLGHWTLQAGLRRLVILGG